MPLAPIPNRRPTAAELRPYIEWCERNLSDRAAPRAFMVRLWAESIWRAKIKQRDPNAFIVAFADSVPNYDTYGRSAEWAHIRQRKMEMAGNKCECCGLEATEVHHRDYRPRVLAGEDLSPLVALCHECHRIVHTDSAGRRREVWQDRERILAELMAGNGCLALGRNKGWFELEAADQSFQHTLLSGEGRLPNAITSENSARAIRDEHLKEHRRQYQREYRRRKRLQALNQYLEQRANLTPYQLGRDDAVSHRSAIETYNARPSIRCPFEKGTPEEAEYDRGWKDVMRRQTDYT